MQIYGWSSQALRNYSAGHILAIGTDVEDARRRARAQFSETIRERWDWLDASDQDDAEDIRIKMGQLEQDISRDPIISDSFFITGGE